MLTFVSQMQQVLVKIMQPIESAYTLRTAMEQFSMNTLSKDMWFVLSLCCGPAATQHILQTTGAGQRIEWLSSIKQPTGREQQGVFAMLNWSDRAESEEELFCTLASHGQLASTSLGSDLDALLLCAVLVKVGHAAEGAMAYWAHHRCSAGFYTLDAGLLLLLERILQWLERHPSAKEDHRKAAFAATSEILVGMLG